MPSAQISPLLIRHLRDNKIKEIPESPTVSWLTGKYVKSIVKQRGKIDRFFEENLFMLTCKSCGRKGKYDVGLMVVNVDQEQQKKTKKDPASRIQTTGYFRCKHCNDAGNWEMPTQFTMTSITAMLAQEVMEDRCTVGENLLFDGSWHLFSTDAEEYLLSKLKATPEDAYIWNRIGNLYHKGNRPELAISAFERSLIIDPNQTESHYTVGNLLSQIEDWENAFYHFKQMLLSASGYQSMDAENLRQMLAVGLQELFIIHQQTNEAIPFLPTQEELEAADKMDEIERNRVNMEIKIFPDETESFYPFAETFMGDRIKELPQNLRTLKEPNFTKGIKQKKKKRWKKRK